MGKKIDTHSPFATYIRDSTGKIIGGATPPSTVLPCHVEFLDPAGNHRYSVNFPDPLSSHKDDGSIFISDPSERSLVEVQTDGSMRVIK